MYIKIYTHIIVFFFVFLAGGGIFCGVFSLSLLRRGSKIVQKLGSIQKKYQWNSHNLGSWIWTSFEHREPHSQDVPFCVHPCWGNATSHGHPGVDPQNQPGNRQVDIPTVARCLHHGGRAHHLLLIPELCPESKAKPKCFQNRFHLNPNKPVQTGPWKSWT